jgi:hypothetical protein
MRALRLLPAFIAYHLVIHSRVSLFNRDRPDLRCWAKIALPLAGDWAYRNEKH